MTAEGNGNNEILKNGKQPEGLEGFSSELAKLKDQIIKPNEQVKPIEKKQDNFDAEINDLKLSIVKEIQKQSESKENIDIADLEKKIDESDKKIESESIQAKSTQVADIAKKIITPNEAYEGIIGASEDSNIGRKQEIENLNSIIAGAPKRIKKLYERANS